ncbi:MAG: FmdB family zinc ribbon protein [Sphaerochaetaceae bacterium]|jgi:putative FmdB family regulatory protein
MPTYEYLCKECEYNFEVEQKMSDAPLSECPKCTGFVRRVFSNNAIIFKGSGFYVTDSRDKSEKSQSD